jgi:uncharacterized protein YyaL (SSP411 family)
MTTNRLATQTSPYLLQHAGNPVNWHPWDAEALDMAVRQDKPIFLSIGYSACHWCHVMAHESFENVQIARLLNENFISIKVDREERPDLDQIYMEAVQLMTGRGGWPMSVFLTPQQTPFYGGTYWPAQRRHGLPGFDEVLRAVSKAWQKNRGDLLQQSQQVMQALGSDPWHGAAGELNDGPLKAAETALADAFDPHYGGFGPAPKFPQPISLRLLLRRGQRTGSSALLDMVNTTLQNMARGGMYDQLGGGFHRYSVDERWLVPHFEKMLYDNALLAGCYLEAWQATGDPLYERVVRETLDYVLRDMAAPDGGFASAEDADSEGSEGKFYVWTPEEIAAVLGEERAKTFCEVYDVTAEGNFEGHNILHVVSPLLRTASGTMGEGQGVRAGGSITADYRVQLLAARARRVRPSRDDKVLVSWNSLLIDALARAGTALNEPRYAIAAAAAADFLLGRLRDKNGRLLHSWRNGRAAHAACLDDYASLANALVTLYEQQPDARWLDEAIRLADAILAHFADPQKGGFFYTADDSEPLIVRKKDLVDNSAPSGNGLAVMVLLRLSDKCGRSEYREAAENTLRACMGVLQQAPTATGELLLALELCLAGKANR